ncbi:hypothetical protein RIF29_05986 [Crotalaria pallida]|uniref:Bromo domain-containing protein n=1 Tax=Crotalaria pallida TaxID=3830 RepID=A0AAN9J5A4_CROPI
MAKPSSHIKLIIKLHASSETQPRKQIVLYVPRSKKRERSPSESSDIRCNKRSKLVAPKGNTDIEHSASMTNINSVTTTIAKDLRTTAVSEEGGKKEAANSLNKMTRKVTADDEVHANPTKYFAKGKGGNGEKERTGTIMPRVGYVEEEKKHPKKHMRVAKKASIESEESERKKCGNIHNKKMMKLATDEVSAYPTESSAVGKSGTSDQCGTVRGRVGSRIGLEECMKTKEKKQRVMVMQMDRYKKMKCWVMLKRLMTGRDSWAFKHKHYLEGLDILDNNIGNSVSYDKNSSKPKIKSELGSTQTIMKPIGLEDIESKLNKLLYTDIDEFADDIRLVFSYALLYPPRHEIYKIARRLSDNFEHSWKSMKDMWSREEGKRKKIY